MCRIRCIGTCRDRRIGVAAERLSAPAAATKLIIALGFLTRPNDLLIIEKSVLLLVLQAIAINRPAGVDVVGWIHRTPRNSLPE